MIYQIAEVFDSIQGEGIDTGKYSTFIRLTGCNLACQFCDTNFTEYNLMEIPEILSYIDSPNIVITGGEPLLQDLNPLIAALWNIHCIVTVETNGTIPFNLNQADKISLSPKVPVDKCKIVKATSLKILYPYLEGITAFDYANFHARYRSLQVIDADKYPLRISAAIDELKKLPAAWRLGLQLHKLIGVK